MYRRRALAANVAYTKRFDRALDGALIHVEDLAQATGDTRGLGHIYNGSHEVIARTLLHRLADKAKSRSSRRRFLRATLFNYIFGNTDAHLKNHSIIWESDKEGRPAFSLAPLYDIVPCVLYARNDGDELGLPLGGKTRGFFREDFDDLAALLSVSEREIDTFVAETRAARQRLVELARAYDVDQGKIESLFELAASRINVLIGVAGPRSAAAHPPTAAASEAAVQEAPDGRPRPYAAATRETSTQAAADLCQSRICLNPNGRTRLRGARRRALGVCSHCDPEG
jgi:hypothetical protein